VSAKLDRFDNWLTDGGPAALVIRECLTSVEGKDGVVFPATFAASEDKVFKGGYNIDDFGDGKNVCLIDSVGSQANRIEPIFSRGDYKSLVPQIIIAAGTRQVNLLEAGHRAGDAIVRCSELQQTLQAAFKAAMKGDVTSLAKIAPTSLVFGVWDSRDTQAKLPRLIASTIRAYDVQRLTRSAQYVPATEYVAEGLLEESADKSVTDAYAAKGFVHVPASAKPGGVIACLIRRDATLHLAALRLLSAGNDSAKTLALRRYVFGLALTAFTHTPSGYLRQGCNLVLDLTTPRKAEVVLNDGTRQDANLSHEDALEYAKVAAAAFGVGESREVEFDKARAKADVSETDKKPKPAKGKK
jgi:CRISPR-associated protein Csb1